MYDPNRIAELIKDLIKNDPQKLDDARKETDWLIEQGALMNTPPNRIMAESCVYQLREANRKAVPDLALFLSVEENEDAVIDILDPYFTEHLAYECTEFYLNGSCIHSEHTK